MNGGGGGGGGILEQCCNSVTVFATRTLLVGEQGAEVGVNRLTAATPFLEQTRTWHWTKDIFSAAKTSFVRATTPYRG